MKLTNDHIQFLDKKVEQWKSYRSIAKRDLLLERIGEAFPANHSFELDIRHDLQFSLVRSSSAKDDIDFLRTIDYDDWEEMFLVSPREGVVVRFDTNDAWTQPTYTILKTI